LGFENSDVLLEIEGKPTCASDLKADMAVLDLLTDGVHGPVRPMRGDRSVIVTK
jgi:hypothetical protein